MRGILLSGGRSRRMGEKKQWLPLGEKPILLHTYREICAISKEVVIVVNGPTRHRPLYLLWPADNSRPFPAQGLFAGLHSGLQII